VPYEVPYHVPVHVPQPCQIQNSQTQPNHFSINQALKNIIYSKAKECNAIRAQNRNLTNFQCQMPFQCQIKIQQTIQMMPTLGLCVFK
jgi:hypothetical protein